MGLITPILTSTAINSEKLGNTLSVLLMTPITSWQIVAGKLFSRLLIAFMLLRPEGILGRARVQDRDGR